MHTTDTRNSSLSPYYEDDAFDPERVTLAYTLMETGNAPTALNPNDDTLSAKDIGTAIWSATPVTLQSVFFTTIMTTFGRFIKDYAKGDDNIIGGIAEINTNFTFFFVSLQVSLFSVMIAASIASGMKKQADIAGKSKLNRDLTQYVRAGFIFALILSCAGWPLMFFTPEILISMGQDPNIIKHIVGFFRVMSFATVIMLFREIPKQLLVGLGQGWHFNSMEILNTAIALAFGYAAMNWLGLGVTGLGLGYLLSAVASTIGFSAIIKLSSAYKEFHFLKAPQHENTISLRDAFKQLTSWGLPITLNLISEVGTINVLTIMAGRLPNSTLNVDMWGVVSIYAYLFVIIQVGLTNAAMNKTGDLFGDKKYKKIQKLGYALMMFAAFIATTVFIFSLIYCKQLANQYLDQGESTYKEAIEKLAYIFPLMMFIQLIDSVRNIALGVLRGLGDTAYPTAISVYSQALISLACAGLFGFTFEGALLGITMGYGVGTAYGTYIIFQRFLQETDEQALLDRSASRKSNSIAESMVKGGYDVFGKPLKQMCGFFSRQCAEVFSSESPAVEMHMVANPAA